MKLTECANCGFYVAVNEKFCPDCGISEPIVPLLPIALKIENQVIIKTVGIIGGAVLVGFIFYRLNNNSVDFGDWFRLATIVLLIATVISVLAVLLNARKSASVSEQTRFINAGNGTSLQFMQDICLLRNHALSEKRHESGGATRRGIRQSDGKITTKERQAANENSRLLARYDLFLNRIFLARLQNELLPLASSPNDLSDAEFFVELDGILLEIKNLSAGIKQDFGGESSESFTTEKQIFHAATKKTEELGAALADRQKERAQLGSAFASFSSENSTNQAEILNSRRIIEEISQSFNKLERDYKGLQI